MSNDFDLEITVLSKRHKEFCEQVIIRKDYAEAAEAVGMNKDMAYFLRKQPVIQEYIKQLEKKDEGYIEFGKKRAIQTLEEAVYLDPRDLIDASGKPKKIEELPPEILRALQIRFSKNGATFSMQDRTRLLELLLKVHGAFKTDISVELKDNLSKEQKDAIIHAALTAEE
jgi:hypothetical protein